LSGEIISCVGVVRLLVTAELSAVCRKRGNDLGICANRGIFEEIWGRYDQFLPPGIVEKEAQRVQRKLLSLYRRAPLLMERGKEGPPYLCVGREKGGTKRNVC